MNFHFDIHENLSWINYLLHRKIKPQIYNKFNYWFFTEWRNTSIFKIVMCYSSVVDGKNETEHMVLFYKLFCGRIISVEFKSIFSLKLLMYKSTVKLMSSVFYYCYVTQKNWKEWLWIFAVYFYFPQVGWQPYLVL